MQTCGFLSTISDMNLRRLSLLSIMNLLNPHKEEGGKEEQDELAGSNNVLDSEDNY